MIDNLNICQTPDCQGWKPTSVKLCDKCRSKQDRWHPGWPVKLTESDRKFLRANNINPE